MAETFVYYKEGSNKDIPVVLLHGTGGTESDLTTIADFLFPDSPQIGIRGRLLENGYTRYFTHDENGGFDLKSLDVETNWLMDEIASQITSRNLKTERAVIIGYSNGANIAINAWLKGKNPIKNGVLFHPMLIEENPMDVSLSNLNLWMSFGTQDSFVSSDNFDRLLAELSGAKIKVFRNEQPHAISEAELLSAQSWAIDLLK